MKRGCRVRSVKIYNEGRPNTEVLRLIEDNIRFPESSLGDLRAQIACCRTGEERLEQICRKYGGKVFLEAVETIWDQTDKLVRAGGARNTGRDLRSGVFPRRRRQGHEQDDSDQGESGSATAMS